MRPGNRRAGCRLERAGALELERARQPLVRRLPQVPPAPGVRIRIHDPAQFDTAEGPHFVNSCQAAAGGEVPAALQTNRSDHRYVSQLEVDDEMERARVESRFFQLLVRLGAIGVAQIAVYD